MKTPAKLGAKARAIWTEITEAYELRADEARLLEDACRQVDIIERLEVELGKADLVVSGSMGQPTVNPLLQEIRQHRTVLKSLLGSLRLPEDESTVASRSASARDLAAARWRRRGA